MSSRPKHLNEALVIYRRIEREAGDFLASLGEGTFDQRERLMRNIDEGHRGADRVSRLLGPSQGAEASVGRSE